VDLDVRQEGAVSRIRVSGCLADRCGEVFLGEVVREQLDLGRTRLLLDLRDVSDVDSTGLAELALVYKDVRDRGARLELLCPSPRLQRLLRLTGLEASFPVHCDERQAIESLGA